MATFFWQAQFADVGGPPSNATLSQPLNADLNPVVIEHSTSNTGAALEINRVGSTSNLRRLLVWDSIDGTPLPAAENYEIFMWFTANGGSNDFAAAVRYKEGTGTADLDLYAGQVVREIDTGRLIKYANGSFSSLGSDSSLVDGFGDYKVRVRVNGDQVQAKIWDADDPEPETWNFTVTDTDITGAGLAGYYMANFGAAGFPPRIYAMGFATDGDTAPSGINVTLTNATATATGETTATSSVDTDHGGGTMWSVASTSDQKPSHSQLSLGQDHEGNDADWSETRFPSAEGTENFSLDGLSSGTRYWVHFAQEHENGEDVSEVVTSNSFNTETIEALVFHDGTSLLFNLFADDIESPLEIDGDFDTGNLHPDSSVSGAASSEPHVTIVPRTQAIENFSGTPRWQQFFFRVDNANAKRPSFEVDGSDIADQITSQWRPWYTYDDPESVDAVWNRWDTSPSNTSGDIWEFQLSSAFTQDTVWIATVPAYPLARSRNLIQWLEDNHADKLHRLPSTDNTSDWAAGFVSAQTDDLGRTIPSLPIRSYGIWDDDAFPDDGLPKRIIILVDGIHSGEHLGSHSMEKAIRQIVADDALGAEIRKNFQVFVYANIVPSGRYGGHYRGQWDPANLDRDANRDWDDSRFELESSQITRDAIELDMGSRAPAFLLDYHSRTWRSDMSHTPRWMFMPDTHPSGHVSQMQTVLESHVTPYPVTSGGSGTNLLVGYAVVEYGVQYCGAPESHEMFGVTDIGEWIDSGEIHVNAFSDIWATESDGSLLVSHHLGEPQNVGANAVSDSEIEVTWDAVSGATAYDIEVDGSVVSLGNVTSHSDTGLSSGQTREYRVRARDDAGPGPWSALVSASTIGAEHFQTAFDEPDPRAGWTERWNSSNSQWTAEGGDILRHEATETNRRFLSWDVTSSPDSIGDVEIVAQVRLSQVRGNQARLIVRGGGTAGSESGYVLEIREAIEGDDGPTFRLVSLEPDYTNLSSIEVPANINLTQGFFMSLRAEGSLIQGRIWPMGGNRPSSAQVSASNSSHTSGRVGLGAYTQTGQRDFAYAAVATGGEVPVIEEHTFPEEGVDFFTTRFDEISPLADWNERWNTDNSDWSAEDGDIIRHRATVSAPRWLQWQITDSPNNINDVEILAQMRTTDLGGNQDQGRLYVRAGGSAGNEAGYFAAIRFTDADEGPSFVLVAYRPFYDLLAVTTIPSGIDVHEGYWMSMRAEGSTLEARIWAEGEARPETPTLTVTDTGYTAGGTGIGAWSHQGVRDWAYVSAATGGGVPSVNEQDWPGIHVSGHATVSVAGAHVDVSGFKSVENAPLVFGGGNATVEGLKQIEAAPTVSAGGRVNVIATVGDVVAGRAIVSGAGEVAAEGEKHAFADVSVTDAGETEVSGQKQAFFDVVVSGAGAIDADGLRAIPAADGVAVVSGAGAVNVAGFKLALGTAVVSGAGEIDVHGVEGELFSARQVIPIEGSLSAHLM